MRVERGRCKNDQRDQDGPAHGPLFRCDSCEVCYARHQLNSKRRLRERRIDELRLLRKKASDPLRREILKLQIDRLKAERTAIVEKLSQLDPRLPANDDKAKSEPDEHVGAA